MTIKAGPAGLGPVKEAIERIDEFAKEGINACEIAFTYRVYIKDKKQAEEIRKEAEGKGVKLSNK